MNGIFGAKTLQGLATLFIVYCLFNDYYDQGMAIFYQMLKFMILKVVL